MPMLAVPVIGLTVRITISGAFASSAGWLDALVRPPTPTKKLILDYTIAFWLSPTNNLRPTHSPEPMTTQSNIARKNQGGAFQRHASGRAIRDNIYGNTVAYIGKRRVHDFGLDTMSANEWLEKGEWLGYAPAGHEGGVMRSVSIEGKISYRAI